MTTRANPIQPQTKASSQSTGALIVTFALVALSLMAAALSTYCVQQAASAWTASEKQRAAADKTIQMLPHVLSVPKKCKCGGHCACCPCESMP